MNKHTPGPWEYDGNKIVTKATVDPNRTTGYGCDGSFVCDLNDGEYHEYSNQEEQDANAALIAAAPDLLAVCEYFMERGNYNDQMLYAVRKAKGEKSE